MWLFWSVFYLVLISLLSHVVGELLPRKWFREEKFPYRAYAWEKDGKIYDKLKIKKWKTKVPDLSKLFQYMVPKRVTSFHNVKSSDFDRILKETCVAEFIHAANCVIAFFVILIAKNIFGILFYILYVFGNIPFIMIQRYNRPHLRRLKEKISHREAQVKIEN